MASVRRLLVTLPLLAALASGAIDDPPGAEPPPEPAASVGPAHPQPTPPVRHVALLSTDPLHAPHAISDRLVELVDGTPAGETIEVVTYFIASRRVAEALRRAVERGVTLHLITAGDDRARSLAAGTRLAAFLDRRAATGTWALSTDHSARGTGGITHQKTWRFSRTGDRRWVVVTGSYNASRRSDDYTYAHMWEVSGDPAIYGAFASIFTAQHADRPLARPLASTRGTGWSAYFLPLQDPAPDHDPVMRRLREIPAEPSTALSIEMYSMWGPRAEWIAERLSAMARAGARITMVAGPWVDPIVQRRMTAAGVRIESGCFADRTFTHAKDMSATWRQDGVRTWWTWIGSDNWTSQGAPDDEAVLGLAGRRLYDEFQAAFENVRRRDGVPTQTCSPVVD
ncbi:MAG: phospholipase D-like domain-containing protein [Nocardioides sp.]|uniref:phospholipase D-like domain-containing protein n=1 Tax=Nocardioides sp. TaxID=35761 RepID=UPI0039E3942A